MSLHSMRTGTLAVLALGAVVAAPAACLFPSYVFDLQGTGGTGGTGVSSSSRGASTTASSTTDVSSSTSTTATTGSTGGGGTGGTGTGGTTTSSTTSSTTTTTTSSTTSSTSGGTCATVDCSDPNCMPAYACVASAPTGWTGPFALYDGAPAGDPGCPSSFPVQAYAGNGAFNAPAPACSVCTCGAPQGQACIFNGTMEVDDSTCGNAGTCIGAQSPAANWTGTCDYNADGWVGGVTKCGPQNPMAATCINGTQACNQSVLAGPLSVTGGACTPSTEVGAIAPVSWGTLGDACGGAPVVTKGCNAMHQCMPKAQAPFASGLCVEKGGDNACPPVAGSPFSAKHIFYGSAADTRSCSACSCDVSAGATCTGTITWYGTTNCSGASTATLNVNTTGTTCAAVAGNPSVGSRKGTFTAPTGGTCAPIGGQPMGMATPQSPTTFCCIP